MASLPSHESEVGSGEAAALQECFAALMECQVNSYPVSDRIPVAAFRRNVLPDSWRAGSAASKNVSTTLSLCGLEILEIGQ